MRWLLPLTSGALIAVALAMAVFTGSYTATYMFMVLAGYAGVSAAKNKRRSRSKPQWHQRYHGADTVQALRKAFMAGDIDIATFEYNVANAIDPDVTPEVLEQRRFDQYFGNVPKDGN